MSKGMPGTAGALDWNARLQLLAAQARAPELRRFYEAGAVAMNTPIEQVPLMALDIETTGLDFLQHGIVSVGLLPLSLRRIHCGKAQYWVTQPGTQLHADSVAFHHITHSDIRHAPKLTHILGDLLEAMAGRVMVVHYRAIERGFLDQAVRRQLGEGFEFPVIDTMQLEARLHRKVKPSWWDRLRNRPPASLRLADARSRYNLPQYHAHHALTDALGTAELLQAQVATHYSPGTPVSKLWVE